METGKLYKVSKDGFHIIEIDPYRSSDRIIGEFPQEYRDTNGGMYIFSSMGSLIVSDGGDKFYSWSTGYKSQDGNNWYNIGLVLVELTLPQN